MTNKAWIVIASLASAALILACFIHAGKSNYDYFFDIQGEDYYVACISGSIYRIQPDGRSPALVQGREVAWMPGGDQFLYEAHDKIWCYDLKKGTSHQLTHPDTDRIDWYPSWAPSIGRVIFTRSEGKRLKGMGGIGGASVDIYSVRLDGSDVKTLTTARFFSATISPHCVTNDSLYFVGQEKSQAELQVYRLDLATLDLKTIPSTAGTLGVSVSNGGTELLLSRRQGFYSIELYDLASGKSKLVKAVENGFVDQPCFSVDDKNVLFLERSAGSGRYCIKRLTLSTRREETVLNLNELESNRKAIEKPLTSH